MCDFIIYVKLWNDDKNSFKDLFGFDMFCFDL